MSHHSGLHIARRYTDLMDRFIRALVPVAGIWEKSAEIREERLALVALGSYGRRELCLGSDLDLLFIHKGKLSPEITETITRVLYPLWDARLEIGHTVLTVQECIRLGREDFRFLTSVMDGRFLMGSRPFFRLFELAFWSKNDREKSSLLKRFLISQQKRQEKYNTQSYFVEPDIKEGLGGLRDLHYMAWMAMLFFKTRRFNDIRRFDAFSHFDINRLAHSKSFLLKVRNHMHQLEGRKEDRLLLPRQQETSHTLGYRDSAHASGLERFMRDLYRHMNRIRYGHEEFQTKTLDTLDPQPFEPTPQALPPTFRVLKGNIVLKDGGLIQQDPMVILEAFVEANQRALFLGSEFIWKARRKIAGDGRRLADSSEAKALFLKMVLNPTNPKILRLALEIGLISLFIPEFKRIRNLAQFSYYHEETVDLHSLKTLEVISKISKGYYDDRWPLFKEIFEELEHPRCLFLAALLHDIGKGYRGDHSQIGAKIIARILKRLGIDDEGREVIPFLVQHHLFLVNISQRRDLNDEKTSVQAAQRVQTVEKLRLLFLLTMADSFATGPMAHGDWKIMLFLELYFKVRHIMERGTLASPDATRRLEDIKARLYKQLSFEFSAEEVSDLMDQVSVRYLITSPLEVMSRHFRLALTMGDQKLNWQLQKVTDVNVTRIILCTYDKPGLFSKLVGVFTLNNIAVLSANIFTLKNGLTFDTYEVTNPPDTLHVEEQWEKIHHDILLTLEDRLPLDALIDRKGERLLGSGGYWSQGVRKVRIDNEVSDFFTGIEVRSKDRVGLLYDLAKEIFALGLDIKFAKVSCDEERMTGVFYVRDSEGQKVDGEDHIAKIKRELLEVMQANTVM